MPPQLAILADDLTGAADTGAAVADAGLATLVPLHKGDLPRADAIVVNSNTRDLDAALVPPLIDSAVSLASSQGTPTRWYKKIDSAFRGHPALEIELVLKCVGFDTAAVCSALPSQGRSVVNGINLIDGQPLHTSSLAQCDESNMLELLSSGSRRRLSHIALPEVRQGREHMARAVAQKSPGIIVIDAEIESDLDIVAQALTDLPDLLMVGSAGLARAIFTIGTFRPAVEPPRDPDWSPGPVLIVSGTRHDATSRQIATAKRNGFTVVQPEQAGNWTQSERTDLINRVVTSLASGTNTVLTVTNSRTGTGSGAQIDAELTAVARLAIEQHRPAGLVVTGGDIAAAMCDALDVRYLWLRGEVLPAIPWTTLGGGLLPNLPMVTKAGSFGGPMALYESAKFLQHPRR